MDRTVYLIYGGDAAQMTSALLHAADIGSRIPGGAHVALKPNLVVAKSACSGAKRRLNTASRSAGVAQG